MKPNALEPSHLLAALNWRRAIKVFDPEKIIPAETWAALEQVLVMSASSYGLQPYRFIVVRDKKIREQLFPHAWDQRQVVDASHLVVFAARTDVTEKEIDDYIQLIAQVRGVTTDSLRNYREMMRESLLADDFKPMVRHWTARQAYIALGNLLTSAALLGVDACPMEGFVPSGFDSVLGLTEQRLTAVVMCALGYRSAADQYSKAAKVRFPVSVLVKHV
ncbi:MAG: NAD(P)H-dependent oxidoreductase [Verrucomicrobiota bacterium]|nr:NAD(P)H-dependent oxidoreductase [Verrucomicrobiota bacterium]